MVFYERAPQRRRQRANVHGLGRDVEEMRKLAANFGVEHADQLGAARHLDAEQLFSRHAERMFLIHRSDVVEPVKVADRLEVRLVLDQLLSPAVQQADVRVNALDHFPIKLQHQTQHAVRCGMLGPEVDIELADFCFGHGMLRGQSGFTVSITP
jgi:hypothetical protein